MQLAKFYAASPDLTERKIEELPYHLQQARNMVALRHFLCDWQVFDRLYTKQHEEDLFKYWNSLEEYAKGGGQPEKPNEGDSDSDVSDTEGKKNKPTESILVASYMDLLTNGVFPANAVRGGLVFKLANFFQESSHHGQFFLFSPSFIFIV